MRVELKAITPNIETTIVEIARVSSSRKDKSAKPEGLINYLIKHYHWSPFEHGYITMEIETSKAIAIQLLRHRSFTFQEFSQRYQDVGIVSEDGMFEEVELRKQATDNRQSSEEVFNPEWETVEFGGRYDGESFTTNAGTEVDYLLRDIDNLYNTLLKQGVARETARMILPMCTRTKLFMTGSVRSWIHLIGLRDDKHAQKEVQLVAKEMKKILVKELPIISKALDWNN